MKRLLLSAATAALLTAPAFAQVTGGTGPANEASANAGTEASSVNSNDSARATVVGEEAEAIGDNGLTGGLRRRARATIGDGVGAETFGDQAGAPNVGASSAGSQSANANAQFQVGNDNDAINMQEGVFNESATLQIGDNNIGLVSQDGDANEAALAQVGNDNSAVAIQQGIDNGAVSAQLGDNNQSFSLQVQGEDNYAAHAQVGNDNQSVAFQDGDNNTVASLQEGTANKSFVSQGGGTAVSLTAINGDVFGAGIFAPTTVSGSAIGSLGSSGNSAANLQLGEDNVSAIVQTGSGNEAVNYQNNR